MSQNSTTKPSGQRPVSAAKRKQQSAMRIGSGMAALFLIVLGSTNLALNVMLFFKQGPNNLWVVSLPFVLIFAIAPIVAGIWLLNRAMNRTSSRH